MKARIFSGKDPVLIIAFLQYVKAAFGACDIQEGVAMGLFENYLSGPVKILMKAQVALPTETVKTQKGHLASFLAIFQLSVQWIFDGRRYRNIGRRYPRLQTRKLDGNRLWLTATNEDVAVRHHLQWVGFDRPFHGRRTSLKVSKPPPVVIQTLGCITRRRFSEIRSPTDLRGDKSRSNTSCRPSITKIYRWHTRTSEPGNYRSSGDECRTSLSAKSHRAAE